MNIVKPYSRFNFDSVRPAMETYLFHRVSSNFNHHLLDFWWQLEDEFIVTDDQIVRSVLDWI